MRETRPKHVMQANLEVDLGALQAGGCSQGDE